MRFIDMYRDCLADYNSEIQQKKKMLENTKDLAYMTADMGK